MSTLSILPLTHDMDWVTAKLKTVALTNHIGYSKESDGFHLVYRATDFDAVQSVLDSYNTNYANEVLRGKMLEQLAEIRWAKTQFIMRPRNGVDKPTWALGAILNLTAKLMAMQARFSRGEENVTTTWKFGEGWYEVLTLSQLEDHGLAIDSYVQGCFTYEGYLAYMISQAADVEALLEIDITTGWPE